MCPVRLTSPWTNSTDVSEDVCLGRTQEEDDTNITAHVKHCLLNVSEMMSLKQLIPML